MTYPSDALRGVLEKTLGVPLFQEQAMQIAIVGAGFTPSESDRLRRAMATFKRVGTIQPFGEQVHRGHGRERLQRAFAERCFKQIEGFGTYGFPESHAASFALLVYVSSWLKCHYPEVFACALLNSQPMGFYAPAQIVRDARDHGVTCCRSTSMRASGTARWRWRRRRGRRGHARPKRCRHCRCRPRARPEGPAIVTGRIAHRGAWVLGSSPRTTCNWIEPEGGMKNRVGPEDEKESGAPGLSRKSGYTGLGRRWTKACRPLALRLGFRQVKGLKQEEMDRLVARRAGGYADLADLRRRAGVSAAALDRLARADALPIPGPRSARRASGARSASIAPATSWTCRRCSPGPRAARRAPRRRRSSCRPCGSARRSLEDYANLRLTLRAHPLALLRGFLPRRMVKAERLAAIDDGRRVEVAGLVLVRQRPGTASGVIFITLEDESGIANLVVWPAVFERFRRVVLGAQLMAVRGKVQKEGLVIHVVADTLIDRTDLLRRLAETDPGFEAPVARADRLKPRATGRRSTPRRDTSSPPFEAPVARADHAKNSGPPDPRDPGYRSRRQRLLARLGKLETPCEDPAARADGRKRQLRNLRPEGFRSRDFH